MDMAMPEMSGLHATMEIIKQRPGTKVLILSMYSDEQYVRNALDAGAKGYILKNAIENDLTRAVKAVAAGEQYLAPELSSLLIRAMQTGVREGVGPVRPADAAREAGAAAHRARQVEQGNRRDARSEREHRRGASREPDERAGRAQDGRARAVRREEGPRPAGMSPRATVRMTSCECLRCWCAAGRAADAVRRSRRHRRAPGRRDPARPASPSRTTTARSARSTCPRRWGRAPRSSTTTTTAGRTCCW